MRYIAVKVCWRSIAACTCCMGCRRSSFQCQITSSGLAELLALGREEAEDSLLGASFFSASLEGALDVGRPPLSSFLRRSAMPNTKASIPSVHVAGRLALMAMPVGNDLSAFGSYFSTLGLGPSSEKPTILVHLVS